VTDLVKWLLLMEIMGIAGVPISMRVFGGLTDRGLSFSKPVGFLTTGYFFWMIATVTKTGASTLNLLGGIAMTVTLGLLLQRNKGARLFFSELRAKMGQLLFHELLFLVVFLIGVGLRWFSITREGASIVISESPSIMAWFHGVLESGSYPPRDPMLSGHPINYYYFGWTLLTLPTTLARISPTIAYNLGMATMLALSAVSVAGTLYNWANLGGGFAGARSRRGIALAGVAMVLFMGNQTGGLMLLTGGPEVVAANPRDLPRLVINGLTTREPVGLGSDFPSQRFDGHTELNPRTGAARFDPFAARIAVWDHVQNAAGQTYAHPVLTEFPFFAYLLGDLHPNLMSLPWTVLAIAMSLNLLNVNAPRIGRLQLIASGFALGALWVLNGPDVLTYSFIFLGALVFGHLRRGDGYSRVLKRYLLDACIVGASAFLAFLPFHMAFKVPTRRFPLAFAPDRTGMVEFVIVFAPLFVPLLVLLVRTASHVRVGSRRIRLNAFLLLISGVALLVGILIGWPLFFLLPIAVGAVVCGLPMRDRPSIAFALWGLAVAALVVWGADLIVFNQCAGTFCPADHLFDGRTLRTNTIFKTYLHVWVIAGLSSVIAIRHLATRFSSRSLLWLVPYVALLVNGFTYTLFAPRHPSTASVKGGSAWSLDGLAWFKRERPAEAEAVQWSKSNVSAESVMLQAPGESYNPSTSFLAWAAGRNVVIGWPLQEQFWRAGDARAYSAIETRIRDVTEIYSTSDSQRARQLLQKYQVGFVLIGDQERTLVRTSGGHADALAKFELLGKVVFEQSGTAIYKIRDS
jgi:YYY domain-containing protein